MREVPLPGLRRRTSPPSAAIRSASAKSSGLQGSHAGAFPGGVGWGLGLWFANGWMLWDGCWGFFFLECWPTKNVGRQEQIQMGRGERERNTHNHNK